MRMGASGGAHLRVLTAFQPPAERWFEYPYVMVQMVPYPNGKAPSESEMRAMVRSISKVNLNKAARNADAQVREVAKTATLSEGDFDPFEKKYTVPLQMRVPGVGVVEGKVVGHFGRHHLIQVCCYDRGESFATSGMKFNALLASFKWEQAARMPESKLGDKGLIIALGAGAGVVLLAMFLGGGKKKPPADIPPPPPTAQEAPWRF